jgi:hypothetical protein
MTGFIAAFTFTVDYQYNSSQSMTAQDSLYSLVDYECLPFHCDWLGCDSPVGHCFYCNFLQRWLSYECRLIEISWTEQASRRPEYRSPPRRVRVILLPPNVLTEPLPSNELFRVYSLQQERVFGEPLASNRLPLWLHYCGFQASCHNTNMQKKKRGKHIFVLIYHKIKNHMIRDRSASEEAGR